MKNLFEDRPQAVMISAYCIIAALMVASMLLELTVIRNAQENLGRVVEQHNVKSSLLTQMRIYARDRSLLLYRMINMHDPFQLDDMLQNFRSLGSGFLELREQLLLLEFDSNEVALLNRQRQLAVDVVASQNRVIQLLLDGDSVAAKNELEQHTTPLQQNNLLSIDSLVQIQQQQNEQIQHDSQQAMDNSYRAIIAITLLAVALSSWLALWVIHKISRSITDIKLARDQHQQMAKKWSDSDKRERAVRQHMLDAVLVINPQGVIESANNATTELFGYSEAEMVGNNISMLMTDAHKQAHDGYLQAYAETGVKKIIGVGRTVEARTKDGTELYVDLGVTEVDFGDRKVFVGILHDSTERILSGRLLARSRKELETKVQERTLELLNANRLLQHAADYDGLTDLPNRSYFMRLLNSWCDEADVSKFALLFMDLDGFKQANDSFGHAVGDQLLTAVAKRLQQSVKNGDVVARLGGDEFTILLQDTNGFEQVAEMCRRLLQAIQQPFRIQTYNVTVGISIGVALYPLHDHKGDDLLRKADNAMYCAKKAGKGSFYFADS